MSADEPPDGSFERPYRSPLDAAEGYARSVAVTADTITDEQLRELRAHHAELDDLTMFPGHNQHTGTMLRTAIALGVLPEAWPGDRASAREWCAKTWNDWQRMKL